MRPIRLKMTAFGPYAKTVELDFEAGLAEEKIFLIHGETGAGKTSILDAICYALYDKSSGGDRTDKMLRCVHAASDTATEVEFEFAVDEKIYRVRRCPKFKSSDRIAELYCDGEIISGKPKDVDPRVREILGFDVTQFRQVVILPQGKFKDFLAANSSDRAKVLNTIFDASFYALIESRLKDKFEAASEIYRNLENQREKFLSVAAVKSVSEIPALVDAAAQNLARAKTKRGELKIQFDNAVAALTAAERLTEQFDACTTAEKNFNAAKIELEKFQQSLEAAETEYNARKAEEPTRLAFEIEIARLEKIAAAVRELSAKQKALAAAETNAETAKNNLDSLEEKQQKYQKRLETLRQQEAELSSADADLIKAQQDLKDASARQTCLDEIARLERNLVDEKEILTAAEKKLERLKTLQRVGMAAKLAETLVDGEPCPVCGAVSHPKPAIAKNIIPTDAEIKRAESDYNAANSAAAAAAASLNNQRDNLKKFAGVPTVDAAQKICNAAKTRAAELKTCRENIRKGDNLTQKISAEVDAARKIFTAKTGEVAALKGTVETLTQQIPPNYNTAELDAKKNRKHTLDAAWNAADKNFQKISREKSVSAGKVQAAQTAFDTAAAAVAGKTAPNLAELNAQKNIARDSYTAAVAETATLETNLQRLNEISASLAAIASKISAAEKNYRIWRKLSEVANGNLNFQRYYLDAIFADVILEANERLERMSGGRYRFRGEKNAMTRRRLEGLDLEIMDAYTGTARAVETLSGGESFLASLSLALGLAAVVKNTAGGIKLDTILIDEGFGSLDSETLDVAMNALVDLQEGGRLVGIISHVDALKNRIPVRLEVTKTQSGSTASFAR